MKLKHQHTQALLKNTQQEKVGVSVAAGSVYPQATLLGREQGEKRDFGFTCLLKG